MQFRLVIIVLFASFLFCANNTFAASSNDNKSSAHKNEASVPAHQSEDEVRMLVIQLCEAINSADADRVLSFWADNGTFIDESGEVTKGKAALKERFGSSLHRQENALVQMHPDDLNFPAPNVAILRGDVSRKTNTIDLPASRFMMVIVKNGEKWQISEASEIKIKEQKPADHLQELSWLIGKWRADGAQRSSTMTVEWAPGQNFIISKITQEKNGHQELDTQLLGWDPRSSSIISWHFGNDGSFGFGHWHKEKEHRWVVDFTGVATDGTQTKAKNVFVIKNADHLGWQSTEQVSGANSIPDTDQINILRVK